MNKQEIIQKLDSFYPDLIIDGDRLYLDSEHLLTYLTIKDQMIFRFGEDGHEVCYPNIDSMEKIVEVWAEFVDYVSAY
jgi:hypothetical protein